MTDLAKIAIMTSHMNDLSERLETLTAQIELERVQYDARIRDLEAALWKSEAAEADAEREVLFVKNTAMTAIRKLGIAIREREELQSQVTQLEEEKGNVVANCESLQRRLISISSRRNGRKFRNKHNCYNDTQLFGESANDATTEAEAEAETGVESPSSSSSSSSSSSFLLFVLE